MLLPLLLAVAAPAADPLARIPAGYTLAVAVPHPRAAADAVRTLPALTSATQLAEIQAALDTPAVRRLAELVAYYERDLGADWPTLLDKLAGRGIALGAMFGQDDGPAVVAVEGTDADAVAKFFASAIRFLETADADNPVSLTKGTRAGADTVSNGKDFHAARRGPTLWVSNRADALHAALDLKGKSLAPATAPARELVGGDPLAWAWLDLKTLKQGQAAADFFAATRKDFLQTVVVGASIDAVRRADLLAVGLHRTPAGARLELKLPAKRADLPPEFTLHVPAGGPGSLPLLHPPGTLYSQSFHLDLGTLWRERAKLINGQQLADIEKAEKDISKLLPNTTLGKLLEGSGAYHRLVIADVPGDAYKTKPVTPLPAAALVVSIRDEQFGKTMAGALRAGAFVATTQYKLKMSTQDIDGVKVVCYRFPEAEPLDADPDRLRFNAVPCFAVVGDQLVVASRPELVRALLPELKKTAGDSPAVWRGRFDLGGAAGYLDRYPEPVVNRVLLGEGVSLSEAKQRAAAGLKWLATLGGVELNLDHQTDAYTITFDWKQEFTAEGARGRMRKTKD